MRITWPIVKLIVKLRVIALLQVLRLLEPDEIFYVGSTEILPPPLSNDEENFLLGRLQRGDKTVKSVFIERNLRLVVYIARKFENTGVGIEDLVSIGTIGLIKAVNTFDPVNG
jgi:RNA polymerase sporulation-specific sigma factor